MSQRHPTPDVAGKRDLTDTEQDVPADTTGACHLGSLSQEDRVAANGSGNDDLLSGNTDPTLDRPLDLDARAGGIHAAVDRPANSDRRSCGKHIPVDRALDDDLCPGDEQVPVYGFVGTDPHRLIGAKLGRRRRRCKEHERQQPQHDSDALELHRPPREHVTSHSIPPLL